MNTQDDSTHFRFNLPRLRDTGPIDGIKERVLREIMRARAEFLDRQLTDRLTAILSVYIEDDDYRRAALCDILTFLKQTVIEEPPTNARS